jgi:DNA-binding NarL/FixJ family response regulator
MPFRSPLWSTHPAGSTPLGLITPAEARVLSLLRLGISNRAIAQALVLSPRTVESHVSSLLAKTGCRNRTQLTLWSLAHA